MKKSIDNCNTIQQQKFTSSASIRFIVCLIRPTILLSFFICGFFSTDLEAQGFEKKEKYLIAPWQVVTDEFLVLDLKQQQSLQAIDSRNNQTYIQVLADDRGRKGHILFQSNEEQQIVLIAISKSLEKWLKCNAIQALKFEACVKSTLNNPFKANEDEGLIDCVINRLNACNTD